MARSQRVVSSPHALHHSPSTSSGVTTPSEDPQSRVIVDGVACSGLKPPRHPGRPSQLELNQYLPKRRSTTRRRRNVSSARGVVRSRTQRIRVPRQAVVQQGRRDESEEIPSWPLRRTNALSANQSGPSAKHMKARSAMEGLKRARVPETVREERVGRTRAAQERERQRHLQEEFLRCLPVSKEEAELRKLQKQETEKDAQLFSRSGVYTREQHQRPRHWTAARVWTNIGGFANLAVAKRPPFGVRDRLQLSTRETSCQ